MIKEILTKENLWHSYLQTQKGKPKHKVPAARFRQNETSNLNEIFEALKTKTWTPKGYYRFEILEKKRRIIYAPSYEDKIVHHMLYQKLREFYEPKFIFDSYSCIRNKGNISAVKRLHWHMKVHKRNNNQTWLVKLDVSKFFPSIDREILKRIYNKHIKCKDTLELLYKVIDSSPTDKGLPLGCVTSQLSANVYMNTFDHFVKRSLKVKHYLRYADDLFIFCASKAEAVRIQTDCKKFLKERLNLDCPYQKTYIQNCNKGIHGLGYKLFYTHILIKSESKRRFVKRWKKLHKLTDREKLQSLNSWCSYSRISKSTGFCNKFCEGRDLIFNKMFSIKDKHDLLK